MKYTQKVGKKSVLKNVMPTCLKNCKTRTLSFFLFLIIVPLPIATDLYPICTMIGLSA